jgi:hypothetical protein
MVDGHVEETFPAPCSALCSLLPKFDIFRLVFAQRQLPPTDAMPTGSKLVHTSAFCTRAPRPIAPLTASHPLNQSSTTAVANPFALGTFTACT